MDLNLGDVIEFKKYEDIDKHDIWLLGERDFPKFATVSEVYPDSFKIEETGFYYSYGAVKRVLTKTEINYMEEKNMGLHIGDVVEFKKYEDISESLIDKNNFPSKGTVTDVVGVTGYFTIEGSPYYFSPFSVKTVHPKKIDADISDVHAGDEVLVKAYVNQVKGKNLMVSWFEKEDVVKILKHKTEKFIVQDDHYGMYVSSPSTLTTDKNRAHIFNSREEANETAADLHLNTWEVIPYDD